MPAAPGPAGARRRAAAAAEPLPPPRPGERLCDWLTRLELHRAGETPPGIVVDGRWWDGCASDPGLDRAVRIEVFPAVGSGLRRSLSRRFGFDLLGTVLTVGAGFLAPAALGALGFSVAAGSFAAAAVSTAAAIGTGLLLNAIAPLPGLGPLPEVGGVGNAAPAYEISGGSNRRRPYEPLPLNIGTMRFAPDLVVANQATRTQSRAQLFFGGTEDIAYESNHIYTGYEKQVTAFVFCLSARQVPYTIFRFTDGVGVSLPAIEDRNGIGYSFSKIGDEDASSQNAFAGFYNLSPPRLLPLRNTAAGFEQTIPIFVPSSIRDGFDFDFKSTESQAQEFNSPENTVLMEARFRYTTYSLEGSSPAPVQLLVGKLGVLRITKSDGTSYNAGLLSNPDSVTNQYYATIYLFFAPGKHSIEINRKERITNSRIIIRGRCDYVKFYTTDIRDARPKDWFAYTGPTLSTVNVLPTAGSQGQLPPMQFTCDSYCYLVPTPGSTFIGKTTNPAWLFYDFALGEYAQPAAPGPGNIADPIFRLRAGTLKWGVGLTDEQIDLDSLRAWAAFCDAQRLECNMVIRNLSRAEALRAIAATGRASPTWHTGKLGVVWDDRRAPSAVFGRGNILPGTFTINYAPSSLADEIKVQWTSADNDYQERSYRVCRPGLVGAPARTTTVRLIGVTRDDQARREARRQAASQQYHRATYTWETDDEGLLVERGDVALVPAHIGEWDTSGHLAGVNDAGDVVTLAAEIAIPDDAASAWLGLRFANGTIHETTAAVTPGAVTQLRLAAPISPAAGLPAAPAPSASEAAAAAAREARNAAIRNVAYLLQSVPANEARTLVKVMEIHPRGANRVRIVARPEDERYYVAAETSDTLADPATPPGAPRPYTWDTLATAPDTWDNWTAWHGRGA